MRSKNILYSSSKVSPGHRKKNKALFIYITLLSELYYMKIIQKGKISGSLIKKKFLHSPKLILTLLNVFLMFLPPLFGGDSNCSFGMDTVAVLV